MEAPTTRQGLFVWKIRVSARLPPVVEENVQEALRMHREVEKRCKKVDASGDVTTTQPVGSRHRQARVVPHALVPR
ncbi:hypothetical protein [Pararobbsia alpina]|uniref:hypothetical protein n=1 Tax=Pararobbsia alpina TaxID=621374 RepID=UPI0015830071|nr:hypothetical protein [Pararobbsia alpina]